MVQSVESCWFPSDFAYGASKAPRVHADQAQDKASPADAIVIATRHWAWLSKTVPDPVCKNGTWTTATCNAARSTSDATGHPLPNMCRSLRNLASKSVLRQSLPYQPIGASR